MSCPSSTEMAGCLGADLIDKPTPNETGLRSSWSSTFELLRVYRYNAWGFTEKKRINILFRFGTFSAIQWWSLPLLCCIQISLQNVAFNVYVVHNEGIQRRQLQHVKQGNCISSIPASLFTLFPPYQSYAHTQLMPLEHTFAADLQHSTSKTHWLSGWTLCCSLGCAAQRARSGEHCFKTKDGSNAEKINTKYTFLFSFLTSVILVTEVSVERDRWHQRSLSAQQSLFVKIWEGLKKKNTSIVC